MAGDRTHAGDRYAKAEALCLSRPWWDGAADTESASVSRERVPKFRVVDGLLYRKRLERGRVHYREVLDEDRRHEVVSTLHRRPAQRHPSLAETYKCVAENYWWEGMYFQIRDIVLSCPECLSESTKKAEFSFAHFTPVSPPSPSQELGTRDCVTKTMALHGADMLSKLRSQREAGLFCDITLRTSGRPFRAHRAVLAAVSDHFQEIFTEMDVTVKADVDLTGFSEESLLSLLEFSYSSTLRVSRENLPEVMAMARHLGMWPAVDACSALLKEQDKTHSTRHFHLGQSFTSACGGGTCHCQRRENRRKRVCGASSSFGRGLDPEEVPRRNLRRAARPQNHNGLPVSPTHRMKLMDFKSPSSKKAAQKFPPVSPSSARLLRSTPGAAKEVRRLLPEPEPPRRKKAPRPAPRLPCTPVKVKQEAEEVGEDELDFARAQEKYKLMMVLGLQRTALLPRPEDLIGWRQKKRLRKLKANNYSLTKRRKPTCAAAAAASAPPGLPFGGATLSLPLCTPVNTCLLKKPLKAAALVERKGTARPKSVPRWVPPSDRSMRSKGAAPDVFGPSFGGRELRRSLRSGERVARPARQPSRAPARTPALRIKSEPVDFSISGLHFTPGGHAPDRPPPSGGEAGVKAVRYNSGRAPSKAKLKRGSALEANGAMGGKVGGQETRWVAVDGAGEAPFAQQAPPASIYSHPVYRAIKSEPVDPVPVAPPFSDPPPPLDRGKRQSKPPIKLLDSGFLFSFCRPAGGAMKKEEESVDICLTRSVSQARETFAALQRPHRTLRARRPPTVSVVKREREERSVSQSLERRPRPRSQRSSRRLTKSTRPEAAMSKPKQAKASACNLSCVMLDAAGRARLKQLRGPRSQAPKVPKASHSCLQCETSYKDCDALVMHRLRHVEGKHWPCPLCCKTFFRLRNVRSHIRTHEPKLYKCRSCIVAGL